MDKNYATKLEAIDKSISAQIASQAKLGGYDIVLAKGVVLYGGSDITEAVKKAVKQNFINKKALKLESFFIRLYKNQ